jgi:hypothetical protein
MIMRDMQFVKDAVCKDEKDETDSFASKEPNTHLQPKPLAGFGSQMRGLPMAPGNLKKGKYAADSGQHGSPMGKPPLSKAIFPVSQSMREQPPVSSFDYGSQGRKSDAEDVSMNEGLGDSTKVGTGLATGGGSNQEIPGPRGARPGGKRY